MQIVDLMVKEVEVRLEEHQVAIALPPAAKEWLAKEGFDPVFGAKPLRRAVQRHIENPLSKKILASEFKHGDQLVVDAGEDGLTFDNSPSTADPPDDA